MGAGENVSAESLRTARLVLRPCTWDDLDALHALWTDAEVRRWLWDDVVIARERAAQVVEESLGSFDAHGFGIWVVRPRDGDEVIGFAGLRFVEGSDEIELLYGLAPAHWGTGLATEAGEAVLAHGFGPVGLPRIAARVDTPNHTSVRVLERLAMAFEGEKRVDGRPTLHYALAREAFAGRG